MPYTSSAFNRTIFSATLIFFLAISNLLAKPKLPENCYIASISINSINESINSLNSSYGDVPLSIDCTSTKNKAEQLTCSNSLLLLMEELTRKSSVYAEENATKQEIDHENANLNWEKNTRNKAKNINKLCEIYIETTNSNLGGLSPYYIGENHVVGGRNLYQITRNNNGAVLTSKTSETLYLGKDCDVFSKSMGKGSWGNGENGFVVTLPNKTIYFNQQDIYINNSNCKT